MKPENFIAFRNEKFYLSNYYPYAPIVYKEINFPTSEHFFHACKTHDKQQQLLIINSNSPGMAKKNGKVVTLRPDWEEVKVNIMRFTLYLKFTQNSNIMKKLLDTTNEELVEYNVLFGMTTAGAYVLVKNVEK